MKHILNISSIMKSNPSNNSKKLAFTMKTFLLKIMSHCQNLLPCFSVPIKETNVAELKQVWIYTSYIIPSEWLI